MAALRKNCDSEVNMWQKMYKIRYITFGCKVNQYETRCLEAAFEQLGFAQAAPDEEPDVVVINSCTVTGSGESRSLTTLRRLRRELPGAVIVLTGCIPQADPEIHLRIPEADIITGTKDRSRIPELAAEVLEHRRRIVEVGEYSGRESFEVMEYHSELTGAHGHTRAFVKIQDGCNCFCTYCIIPYARGRCRSKPPELLREEIVRLAAEGVREIVLTGINLAFYGTEYGLRLADAAELCCGVTGIDRVRLGSLEPERISDDDLVRLSRLEKLCPQFHLSLQSGCDRTLKAMGRRYTAEEYYQLTRRILHYFPDCAFTTDIMAGFPGETEEDFEESVRFVRRVGFSRLHVFTYSQRRGTPAASMPQLPQRVRKQRADRLRIVGNELHAEHLARQVGRTVPVLFEREEEPDIHHGYAPDMTLIKIPEKNYKKSLRNSIFYVTIEESGSEYCTGRITGECRISNKGE